MLSGQFSDRAVALFNGSLSHRACARVGVCDGDAAKGLAGTYVGITLVIILLIDGIEQRVVPLKSYLPGLDGKQCAERNKENGRERNDQLKLAHDFIAVKKLEGCRCPDRPKNQAQNSDGRRG